MAWEVASQKLKSGGLYICDNTLWSGKVAEKNITLDDKSTPAIQIHNKKIYENKNFDTTLIPLRDGVIVARKR